MNNVCNQYALEVGGRGGRGQNIFLAPFNPKGRVRVRGCFTAASSEGEGGKENKEWESLR